ncbi:MAG TPA: prephenate dehydrogenase/arogenate dehydrogenase family protein [Negativicutes bacterium]|nr:prephenate dehydrogenase/arogenate dehydrogenase family protein [Negativicutes bacterium]
MKTTQVAILGLGLIGGSLGLALRAIRSEKIHVTGYARRAETGEMAISMGVVDSMAATPAEAVAEADFVFLCTPVLQMLPMAQAVLPRMKQGAVLTDAGSTKRWFAEALRPLLPTGVLYIGGHPMAGRERSGLEAAVPDLFLKKWYLFTPSPDAPAAIVSELRRLIGLTGAMTAVLDEKKHDQITAVISHVPHVAAAALVHLLKKEMNPAETARFIGGGFRDTTRIASSDADMWADICMTNPENIAAGLDEMAAVLAEVSRMIRAGDRAGIHTYFSEAKRLRDTVLAQEKSAGE